MLDIIEVVKSNFSSLVAGKLLVPTQEKEDSMGVNILFRPAREVLKRSKSKDTEMLLVKADGEKERFFASEVILEDVPTEYRSINGTVINGKIEDRYSWMKGEIDKELLQKLLLEKISDIFAVSYQSMHRSDFYCVVSKFSFELVGQVLFKLRKYARFFQILNGFSINIQVFFDGDGDVVQISTRQLISIHASRIFIHSMIKRELMLPK